MTSTYDFIIIGGGTSGLVLANRLSEDPKIQVLVLEAGQNLIGDLNIRVPDNMRVTLGSSADWGFTTTPQPQLNNRKISMNQGRALGGSSAINVMVYVPPSKTVIDAWEELGNEGWGWEAMEPYFAKAFSIENLDTSAKERLEISWPDKTTSGPIQTSFDGASESPFSRAWHETLKEMDLLVDEDPSCGVGIGSFPAPRSIDRVTGERSYSANTYYATAANRQNLHVMTGCLVEKIMLENQGSEVVATGVQFLQNDQAVTVKAEKEVILAAGALQSPKILELSGIGDKKLLEKHCIKVMVENPHVGDHLQDHIMNRFIIADEDPGDETFLNNNPTPLEAAMITYNKQNPSPSMVKISSIAYLPILNPDREVILNTLFQTHPFIPDPNPPPSQQRHKQ